MKHLTITLVLILFITLPGCNPQDIASPPAPSPTPSAVSAASPTPVPPIPPEGIYELGSGECDFDGDGVPETVVVNVDVSKEAPDKRQLVYAEITGKNMDFYEELPLEPMHLHQTISIDLDGDGCEEFIIVGQIGGQGGWGALDISVLTYDGNAVGHMIDAGFAGFKITGKLLPQYEGEITVTETGNVLTFPFEDRAYFDQEGYYDDSGNLLKDGTVNSDAICYVTANPDNGVVEIGQFLWSEMHSNGDEFLITELTFDKNGYTVVSQRVETYEYAKPFVGMG